MNEDRSLEDAIAELRKLLRDATGGPYGCVLADKAVAALPALLEAYDDQADRISTLEARLKVVREQRDRDYVDAANMRCLVLKIKEELRALR